MVRRATRQWSVHRRIAFVVVAAVVMSWAWAAPGAPAAAPSNRSRARTPSYDATIDIAVADIQAYWSEQFPDLYGDRYVRVPPKRVVAVRPGVKVPPCQGHRLSYRDVQDNAFYCFRDNFVAYDDAGLFPDLYEDVGPFSIALVLAHEWGHAIQDRAGDRDVPTIYAELQSDCFAGAWTADVSNHPQQVPYAPGDLEVALAALLRFRDAPGSSPDDPAAHGSAFDRVSAFQDGFERGPQRCAAYFEDPPPVVQIPFSNAADAASGGNVPAEDVIPLTVDLLNEFYARVVPTYRPLRVDDVYAFDSNRARSIPTCGGSRPPVANVRNRVYFCIDDEYIAFDEPFLQRVYDEIGDFGVAALIANPWATHVQADQGIPGVAENTLEAIFQADCYTGGWVYAFYNGFLSGGSLSSGDLDELVQAVLVYSRARGVSADVPISFVRVNFFRHGFLDGYNTCSYAAIKDAVANL